MKLDIKIMTQPETVKQYRNFFSELGISHLEIKEKYGDLRKRDTWVKAYGDYTIPSLPIIKAINETAMEKADSEVEEPTETLVKGVVEVVGVVKVEKSSSTLEQESKSHPTPTPSVSLSILSLATPGNPYCRGVLGIYGQTFAPFLET